MPHQHQSDALPPPGAPGSAPPALLAVRDLVCHFPLRSGPGRASAVVRAVDGLDFDVLEGETLGVVGESGCGKSTTARLLMQLIAPTRGQILFDARSVGARALPLKEYRRQVQMVFQDSYASLNPRLTVADSIAFGAQVHGLPRRQALARAHDLLARVGLAPQRFAGRWPHELSGGQRQRVNIARALALQPRMVIFDEAVSALDQSVQAQVINLLLDLKAEFGLTYLFISHDLNVVRYLSDRVLVMYLGQVVEVGPAAALYRAPAHPYTRALLSSMPTLDPDRRSAQAALAGDPPNPVNPPTGCRFHPRCALAAPLCATRAPQRIGAGQRHAVSCLAQEPGSGHPLAAALPASPALQGPR